MERIYKKVTFSSYTGTNSQIKALLQKEFDVVVRGDKRLIFSQNNKTIFVTSPVVKENNFRCFEFQNYNFVTQSGTGYSIAVNKKDSYSGLF